MLVYQASTGAYVCGAMNQWALASNELDAFLNICKKVHSLNICKKGFPPFSA